MNVTTILKYELARMNTFCCIKKKMFRPRTCLSYRFGDWFYEESKLKKAKKP